MQADTGTERSRMLILLCMCLGEGNLCKWTARYLQQDWMFQWKGIEKTESHQLCGCRSLHGGSFLVKRNTASGWLSWLSAAPWICKHLIVGDHSQHLPISWNYLREKLFMLEKWGRFIKQIIPALSWIIVLHRHQANHRNMLIQTKTIKKICWIRGIAVELGVIIGRFPQENIALRSYVHFSYW